MAIIVGLDPGISGAIAIIDRTEVLYLDDLPTHKVQHGQRAKVRHELDLHTLCETLAQQQVNHCYIERVGAMPKQGLASTFRFAESYGQLQGVIVNAGIPLTFIRPLDWQRHHGVGNERDGYRQRAVQLFPDSADRLKHKRDHNRAAALLIAAYGSATLDGQHRPLSAAGSHAVEEWREAAK